MGGCSICGEAQRESSQNLSPKQKNPKIKKQIKVAKADHGYSHELHQKICKVDVMRVFNNFLAEIEQNNRAWKAKMELIRSCEDGILQEISQSKINEFSFQSVQKGYEGIFKAKLEDMKIYMLQAPYNHSCKFFQANRMLVINIQFFLRALQLVIVNGYFQETQEYIKRKKFFLDKQIFLLQMIQKLIELCKDSTKRKSFRISTQEGTHQNLNSDLQAFRQITSKQEKKITMLLNEIEKLNSQNARLQRDTTIIADLRIEIKEKDRLIHQYEVNLSEKQKILASQATSILYTKPISQNVLQLKGKQIDRTLDTNYNSTLSSQMVFEGFNKQLQAKDLQITQLRAKLSQLQTHNLQVLETKKKHQFRIQAQTLEIAELKKNLQSNEAEIAKLNIKIKQGQTSQNDYPKLTAQFELDKRILDIEDLQELNQELARQLDELKIRARLRSKSIVDHKTLFVGDILENKKQEKRFLIDSIENHILGVISKTKLLYEFSRDASTNFHKMIDNHSNLVVIVETANHVLLAGFYSGQYAENVSLDEEALLISLTNSKTYCLNNLKNNPKKDIKDKRAIHGMVYDKYYLIIGNSEIRLRQGEKKIYSNFGVQNGFFLSNGDGVDNWLCQGKKNQVEIINYEIHEAFFDQEYESALC